MNVAPNRHRDGLEHKGIDAPIAPASYRYDDPRQLSEGDIFEVRSCPHCGSEHRYVAFEYPAVALGGLSEARCKVSGFRFYIILPYISPGSGVPSEVIHYARRELTGPAGDALRRPLIPKGFDHRAINERYVCYVPKE